MAGIGALQADSRLQAFLYLLMRDHVTPGTLASVMEQIISMGKDDIVMTNGWLGMYAGELAEVLTAPKE